MARRGERPPIGIGWLVSWPLSAALAAIVFLAAEELRQPAPRETAPPLSVAVADWRATFPDRIDAVDASLRQADMPAALPAPVEELRGSGPLRWTYRLYEVELRREQQEPVEAAFESLRAVDPGVSITAENTADATEVRIGLDGLLVSTVRLLWREAPRSRPRVAVVIGSLGDDLRAARQVVEIDAALVLGVRPFRPFSRQVAQLGRMFHREVVLQLDGSAPPSALAADARDPARHLDAALATVPDAVGVIWQPREAGTEVDRRLVAEVERRRLLFLGRRVDEAAAPSPPLPAPVVLTVDGDEVAAQADSIAAQLGTVASRARTSGRALAMAEPNEATLIALQRTLPEWRAEEIDLVPVSTLGAAPALSAR